jgi:hypothetical protein
MSKQSKKKERSAWSEREWIEYLALSVHSLNMENQLRKREIEALKRQFPEQRAGRRKKMHNSHTKPTRVGPSCKYSEALAA